jgi:hypothetical protein
MVNDFVPWYIQQIILYLCQVSVTVEDSKSYFEGGRAKGGEEFVYQDSVAWAENAEVQLKIKS